ncbi:YifB family Mg chelatase-like AAA ATPase [Bacillus benzoevorans]|uniref:Magnesium chelatase family protein n=1 Tax=Bacillus benzoevorans TaxID=1456 RepID=A0A7X0HVI5_9BACI|nr:YifB family Mg chelatase-like AAA ATPase [Bacillus benzoevorans]MBB6446717.1 magnesium chelatase family protein [Bacillus benzoevorans]
MATIVNSIGLRGIEGYLVQIEVQIVPGKEGISIVGLPDLSVKESKDRVLGALASQDCELPEKRIIINLSPAEQKKNSPIFDLGMAIGMMREVHHFSYKIPNDAAFLGVLSLDGSIKPVDGMLPAIMAAREEQIKTLYLPHIHDLPIQEIDGMELRFVTHINEVIESFSGQTTLFTHTSSKFTPQESTEYTPVYSKDFKDIIGHKHAKRAFEIAAAGGHNILMSGPPGCGKSLLAETFPSILPPLTNKERFEVISIYQLAREKNDSYQISPFRAPHHSSSAISLIGGGTHPKPGEVSLAHNGVLFLDEMAEFPKRTLDMLRQPLESGKVTISRAASTATYPSRFILVGAMNPCPCGYLGAHNKYCTCTSKQVIAYQNRISGPMKDRFDLLLTLQSVSLAKEGVEQRQCSAEIRKRVVEARDRQYKRYGDGICNGNAPNELFLECTPLTSSQRQMMQQWSSKEQFSNRVQMKIHRLARTISDLQGQDELTNESLWEAVNFRRHQLRDIQKVQVNV